MRPGFGLHTVYKNMINPSTLNAKSSSDWAEIISIGSFIYLKNIVFYALIFLSHTVKKLLRILLFLFLKFVL
jgi:hypothetical protein